jgi:phosphocarrier protein HPr
LKHLQLKISNRLGLHARAAAKFVHLANEFECRLQVRKGNVHVDGKSILGLLTLAASEGTVLELLADGEDESEAAQALGKLVQERFGEAT